MCGIIGYVGQENAVPKLTKGLSVLEYRGYDSVGLAVETEGGIETVKCRGRIGDLEERLSSHPISGAFCGIGHTRWATHGGPSDRNAHPHRRGRVVLVHNGIIENYRELKKEVGGEFLSDTDTEVAAAVIDAAYTACNDPSEAIRRGCGRMTGSYAFGILFTDRPGAVYAVRVGSPLLLAKGEDGMYLASDLTALLPFTRTYYTLKEGEIACLSASGILLDRGNGESGAPEWSETDMTAELAEKGGYPHFMLKEIYEQPEAIRNAVMPRVKGMLPDFSADGIEAGFFRETEHIDIVACGSAMHAGLVGVRLFADLARIPAASHIASEYRYHPPIARKGTLVIVISQSGETADTLAALRYAKAQGLPTLAIVNAVETTIAREADHCLYTYAGPEIAVATTKGYCTQAAMLCLIAAAIAYEQGACNKAEVSALMKQLSVDAPRAMEAMLTERDAVRALAHRIAEREHVFFIGRGMDYALAEEGALKLKEISYIHAEAYAAGELKHGTISLIEAGTPVIALSTEEALLDKTESNVREVESRGAEVILITGEHAKCGDRSHRNTIRIPDGSLPETLFSALTVVQLLAYETAAMRGCDIDRPRNLAKSVTVE